MIYAAIITVLIDMSLNICFDGIERTLNSVYVGSCQIKVGDEFSLIMLGDGDDREYFYECTITTISGPYVFFDNHYVKTVKSGNGMGDVVCDIHTKCRIDKIICVE